MHDETYQEYERLRKEYLEKFGEEAPFCMPIEMTECSEEIKESLKTGVPLEQLPEGAVT
jgi:hypothetical protein